MSEIEGGKGSKIDDINLYNACSFKNKDSKTCMSEATLQKLQAQEHNLNLNGKTLAKIIEEKGKTLDELGLLLDKRTIEILGDKVILNELLHNFKPVGPTDYSLFNNFHEDSAIRQLAKYDEEFIGLDVNLMDFQDYGGSLIKLQPVPEGIRFGNKIGRMFGCVMNTLEHKGDLTKVGHWVALFGNFCSKKLNTIEYFNSSGRHAPKQLFAWMEQFAAKCQEVRGIPCIAVNVSNIQHQKSDTECGAYALYYITARLLGITYKKFRESPISDERVNKFRANMFNDQKAVENIGFLEKYNLL
jgi:hypothetical protein